MSVYLRRYRDRASRARKPRGMRLRAQRGSVDPYTRAHEVLRLIHRTVGTEVGGQVPEPGRVWPERPGGDYASPLPRGALQYLTRAAVGLLRLMWVQCQSRRVCLHTGSVCHAYLIGHAGVGLPPSQKHLPQVMSPPPPFRTRGAPPKVTLVGGHMPEVGVCMCVLVSWCLCVLVSGCLGALVQWCLGALIP